MNSGKPSAKSKPSHQLIAEYSLKQGKGLTITINTPFPKLENHYVYGDRLQKILNEVHEFYDQSKGQQRLVKSIKLPLGDLELLKNDKALTQQIFPKMTQLKQMQSHLSKDKKISSSISLQVTWRGSPKPVLVKCSYVRHYEPELFYEYNEVRKSIQDRWKEGIRKKVKADKKKQHQQLLQSRKRKLSESLEESFGEKNGRKMLKVQEIVVDQELEQLQHQNYDYDMIGFSEQGNSEQNGQDSTEDHDKEEETKRPEIKKIQQQNKVYLMQGNLNNFYNKSHILTTNIPHRQEAKPSNQTTPPILKAPTLRIAKPKNTYKPVQIFQQQTVAKTQQTQNNHSLSFTSVSTKLSYSQGQSSGNKYTKRSAPMQNSESAKRPPIVIEIDDD